MGVIVTGCLVLAASVLAAPQVTSEPQQQEVRRPRPIPLKGYKILPQKVFRLEGRVLARKRYWFGNMSDLCPVDLAMGWGAMSDPAIVKDITVRQSGRWYHWKSRTMPISRTEVSRQSANMHMIPLNDAIEKRLKKVKKGQVIRLSGKLVNVEQNGDVVWKSSLTRTDTGNHSCEIVLVEAIQVVKK